MMEFLIIQICSVYEDTFFLKKWIDFWNNFNQIMEAHTCCLFINLKRNHNDINLIITIYLFMYVITI